MSRRKQTKPFKVEDKELETREKKLRSRRSTREIESIENIAEPDISETDEDGSARGKGFTKCDECGKTLASTLSLARHKLTHSESKPYRCPHCNAGFKTSSNMHRHVRIHLRENCDEVVEPEPLKPPRPSVSNQRSPRQNIRTPNKFREFDVDLVGIGPRLSGDTVSSSKIKSENEEYDFALQNSSGKLKSSDDPHSDAESASKAADLVCHICGKTFISKFGLLTHTLTHNGPEDGSDPLRCDSCDQTFSTKRGLTMHNVVEHKISKDRNIVPVKESEEFFEKISKVDFSANVFSLLAEKVCSSLKHKDPVLDRNHAFLCKKCDISYPTLDTLRFHMRVKHQEQKTETETLFSSVNLMKTAETEVSKEEYDIFNGQDDDVVYTSKLVSIKHIPKWLQTHPDVDPSAYDKESAIEPVPYASKLDLYDVKSPANQQHDGSSDKNQTNPHSNNRKKMRNNVDSGSILRRFDTSLPRKIDISKMTAVDKNVFWCKICNYSSHEKSALVRHLLTHSGIRPYFCKLCDYAFTTKANCERHVRKRHNRVTREELDESVRCDWELLKKAPREDIYMVSASSSSCPVCQKSFTCSNEMKQHMKTHEERHFLCQLCGVRCTTRNNCVRHILHKHPGIPHKEANAIISFRGNGPNDLDLDIEAMTTDSVEEPRDIDISRGRLGARSGGKAHMRWKKPSIQRKPEAKQPSAKRPRLDGSGGSKKASERDTGSTFVGEGKKLEKDVVVSNAGANKTSKIIPLIPLLKIKAYNEAAAKSYAQMVAIYEQLNFLNPIQPDGGLLDMTSNFNQTVDDTVNMTDNNDAYLGGETTFVCRTCAKAFDTKELLEIHIPQCEYSSESGNKSDEPVDMSFGARENEPSDVEDSGVNGSVLEDEWDQTNRDDIMDETKNATAEEVKYNEIAHSSFNAKSSEESASTQEYDSAYGSDKPRSSTYGKEPSYVEDSLLMSLFGEGESSETEVQSKENMSSSRYSSDLPTMVDMTGNSLGIVPYQGGGLDGEEKSKNKPYHGRKCPQCNKTFPWASSLRRHIMTHTGLKLYMCRLCKMRFTTRSNLIRHVYRRHGMAKQHPDFAACLAKLNPSDSLLREVEADVRRRVDVKRRRIPGTRNAYERLEYEEDDEDVSIDPNKRGLKCSNFQSMLEDDPETMLVDLDYSPRDELNGLDDSKQLDTDQQEGSESQGGEEEDDEEKTEEVEPPKEDVVHVKKEPETEYPFAKFDDVDADTETSKEKSSSEVKEKPNDDVDFDPKIEKKQTKAASKTGRYKNSSNFVCGLCKKIFKNVDELISHLDVHNIPHCWHCPVCRVPFTNKYNCQRHVSRRHGRQDLEPRYVEDRRHGPRNARGLPKSSRSSPEWKPKRAALNAV